MELLCSALSKGAAGSSECDVVFPTIAFFSSSSSSSTINIYAEGKKIPGGRKSFAAELERYSKDSASEYCAILRKDEKEQRLISIEEALMLIEKEQQDCSITCFAPLASSNTRMVCSVMYDDDRGWHERCVAREDLRTRYNCGHTFEGKFEVKLPKLKLTKLAMPLRREDPTIVGAIFDVAMDYAERWALLGITLVYTSQRQEWTKPMWLQGKTIVRNGPKVGDVALACVTPPPFSPGRPRPSPKASQIKKLLRVGGGYAYTPGETFTPNRSKATSTEALAEMVDNLQSEAQEMRRTIAALEKQLGEAASRETHTRENLSREVALRNSWEKEISVLQKNMLQMQQHAKEVEEKDEYQRSLLERARAKLQELSAARDRERASTTVQLARLSEEISQLRRSVKEKDEELEEAQRACQEAKVALAHEVAGAAALKEQLWRQQETIAKLDDRLNFAVKSGAGFRGGGSQVGVRGGTYNKFPLYCWDIIARELAPDNELRIIYRIFQDFREVIDAVFREYSADTTVSKAAWARLMDDAAIVDTLLLRKAQALMAFQKAALGGTRKGGKLRGSPRFSHSHSDKKRKKGRGLDRRAFCEAILRVAHLRYQRELPHVGQRLERCIKQHLLNVITI
eukprot:g4215.t1